MDYEIYMRRALDLAAKGRGLVSPNPMVGAVVVAPDGKIIGEGWHRRYGEAHAEVNACNSVEPDNRHLISQSTIFVTLEPCSHYGKTPPCADLLVRKQFKRVVIGATDPFHKVHGNGIKKLVDAGIEVVTGVLVNECKALNKTFFFAHTNTRPFVTIKWAQSADGWMDSKSHRPYRFSNDISQTLTHRLRTLNDAILTSTRTVDADNPRLDARFWQIDSSLRPVIVGSVKPSNDSAILKSPNLINYIGSDLSLNEILSDLYVSYGVTSVLLEAGPRLLQEFIDGNLWEEARVEVNPVILGSEGLHASPKGLPIAIGNERIGDNLIFHYANYSL